MITGILIVNGETSAQSDITKEHRVVATTYKQGDKCKTFIQSSPKLAVMRKQEKQACKLGRSVPVLSAAPSARCSVQPQCPVHNQCSQCQVLSLCPRIVIDGKWQYNSVLGFCFKRF